MASRGRGAKAKGAKAEREIAAINREAGFTESKRGVQYHGGPDSPDVTGIPGVHLEVKRVEQLHLWPSLAQAREDAADGEYPVVVHRANKRPWIAILPYTDFLEIYQGYLKSLEL